MGARSGRRTGSSSRSKVGEGSSGASPSEPAPLPKEALPKISEAGEKYSPCEAFAAPTEGTAYQWQIFGILLWIKSKQQRDIVCPCSTDWTNLENWHYYFFFNLNLRIPAGVTHLFSVPSIFYRLGEDRWKLHFCLHS